MVKRKPKEPIKSDTITKYLMNKMFYPSTVITKNIDDEIKKLNKLSKSEEIEIKLKNVEYQINSFLS